MRMVLTLAERLHFSRLLAGLRGRNRRAQERRRREREKQEAWEAAHHWSLEAPKLTAITGGEHLALPPGGWCHQVFTQPADTMTGQIEAARRALSAPLVTLAPTPAQSLAAPAAAMWNDEGAQEMGDTSDMPTLKIPVMRPRNPQGGGPRP